MNNWLNKTRQFIHDTMGELKKCSWPSRAELYESTILVITAVLFLAFFVSIVDVLGRELVRWLTTM